MSWFSRFFRLLYVAYLDCENTLRVLAYLTIGVVIGLMAMIFAITYLPPDYDWFSLMLVSITFWNLGILLVLSFQYIVSLIIVASMVKVAYIYDNQSWGYIHSFKSGLSTLDNQLNTDKLTKLERDKQHQSMLSEKIAKIKE